MAIRDAFNRYSNAQALTVTVASTDLIDHGADNDLGTGEPMVVEIILDVVADDTTGDETYTATLQTDSTAAFSSATQVGGIATITRGDVAGTRYYIQLPPDATMEQFSRINFTLGGTTPTVTVTAHLIPQSFVDQAPHHAKNYTVS